MSDLFFWSPSVDSITKLFLCQKEDFYFAVMAVIVCVRFCSKINFLKRFQRTSLNLCIIQKGKSTVLSAEKVFDMCVVVCKSVASSSLPLIFFLESSPYALCAVANVIMMLLSSRVLLANVKTQTEGVKKRKKKKQFFQYAFRIALLNDSDRNKNIHREG